MSLSSEVAGDQMFSRELLAEARARYAATLPTGRLMVSVDPAGASGNGDDSAFGYVVRQEKSLSTLPEDGRLRIDKNASQRTRDHHCYAQKTASFSVQTTSLRPLM